MKEQKITGVIIRHENKVSTIYVYKDTEKMRQDLKEGGQFSSATWVDKLIFVD